MAADVVADVLDRYQSGLPLPIVSGSAPEREEGLPPARGGGALKGSS